MTQAMSKHRNSDIECKQYFRINRMEYPTIMGRQNFTNCNDCRLIWSMKNYLMKGYKALC